MRKTRQSSWQPVIVEWIDAQTHNGDYKFDEIKFDCPLRRTMGFLVLSTREVVAVAGTDDRGNAVYNNCADVTVIPRGMVQKIIRLKEEKRRAATQAA